MTQRVLRTYFWLVFFFELAMSFHASVYVLFLLSRGMNLFQVGLINMIFMLASFFFEIPTGAFADTIGRKPSFVLSCVIVSVASFVYFFSHSFWQFIIAELIAALGLTFHSGAFQAWIVDSLKYYNYRGEMEKVYSKEKQIGNIARIPGSLLGILVGRNNLSLPWLMSAIGMLILGVVAYIVMEERYFKGEGGGTRKTLKGMKKVAVNSFIYGLKNKTVFTIICFGVILAFCVQAPNMYWQPRFKQLSANTMITGWLFVSFALTAIMGNKIAVKIMKIFKDGKIGLVVSFCVTGVGLIVASLFSNFCWVLIPFLVHEIGRGAHDPVKSKYLNDNIPSEQRATINSFDSMCAKGGSALGLLTMGFVAKNISISFAWLLSGVVLILGTLALYFRRR